MTKNMASEFFFDTASMSVWAILLYERLLKFDYNESLDSN
jgi:hypothetical protein